MVALDASAIGKSGQYRYKAPDGTVVRFIRWGVEIVGQKQPIQLSRNDAKVTYQNGVRHQSSYWLYEYTKGDWMYFQDHETIGSGGQFSPLKYKAQNRWFKVSTDWSIYIDERGVRHTLIFTNVQ